MTLSALQANRVRPEIVMVSARGLRLTGSSLTAHGRDQTSEGLSATIAVNTRQTDGARVAPRQTFQGPSSAMTF